MSKETVLDNGKTRVLEVAINGALYGRPATEAFSQRDYPGWFRDGDGTKAWLQISEQSSHLAEASDKAERET